MKSFGRSTRTALLALTMLTLLAATGTTQRGSPPPPPNPLQVPRPDSALGLPDPRVQGEISPEVLEKQARLRNDERQRRLVSDTDKLLDLATKLHADVAKTDKHMLSIDVIRRADEIEKLAHSVKERMKG